MAYVTLAAAVGQGTASARQVSSRTGVVNDNAVYYETHAFAAASAAGWVFARWEWRSRYTMTLKSTGDTISTSEWANWDVLATGAASTREFACKVDPQGSATWATVTTYAYEVRAVFRSATGLLLHGAAGTLLHGAAGTLLHDA